MSLHLDVRSRPLAVLILGSFVEFPHPIGRIAAVADQSEGFAVEVKPMRYRGRSGDGKIRSDRFMLSRVRRFVHVQKQHRTLNACRLKDPSVEDSCSSRCFPVDPVDRVAGSVFPQTAHECWVLEQPILDFHFSHRSATGNLYRFQND